MLVDVDLNLFFETALDLRGGNAFYCLEILFNLFVGQTPQNRQIARA